MIDRYKHQQLQIGLVSPQQISAWANKTLPNGEIVGEVTEIEHVEWETNKPKIGGFFCERIFGPIKSGICACGHYGEFGDQKEKRTFCDQFTKHRNDNGAGKTHARLPLILKIWKTSYIRSWLAFHP